MVKVDFSSLNFFLLCLLLLTTTTTIAQKTTSAKPAVNSDSIKVPNLKNQTTSNVGEEQDVSPDSKPYEKSHHSITGKKGVEDEMEDGANEPFPEEKKSVPKKGFENTDDDIVKTSTIETTTAELEDRENGNSTTIASTKVDETTATRNISSNTIQPKQPSTSTKTTNTSSSTTLAASIGTTTTPLTTTKPSTSTTTIAKIQQPLSTTTAKSQQSSSNTTAKSQPSSSTTTTYITIVVTEQPTSSHSQTNLKAVAPSGDDKEPKIDNTPSTPLIVGIVFALILVGVIGGLAYKRFDDLQKRRNYRRMDDFLIDGMYNDL